MRVRVRTRVSVPCSACKSQNSMLPAGAMAGRHQHWTVVETGWAEEALAAKSIAAAGHRVYFPKYYDRKQRRGKLRERPLFITYVFAQVDNRSHEWRGINSVRGVRRVILGGPETPSRLPVDFVKQLRSREDADGYVLLEPPPVPLILNQQVLALTGMMAGQTGTFLGKTNDHRCRVLFQMIMMGQSVESELALSRIDLASV